MSKIFKYESGATLIYEKNTINKITNLRITFDCGSRCDDKLNGLAHFVEHMFFTGTKDKNKQQISKEYFDFVGVNAFTNTQTIRFGGEVFSNELGDYLSLVSRLINDTTFSTKNVEEEKKVVLQEIVKDSDNYKHKASRESAYDLYGEDYLKVGVLGTKKTVSAIKSKDVKDFVKKYFVANNCYIYVVSTLPFEKVKKLVEKNLISKLQIDNNLIVTTYNGTVVTDKWKVTVKKADIDKNFLHIAFRVNDGFNNIDKLVTAFALTNIMSNVTDGVLKTLRLEKGLVYSGYFYIDCNKESSAVVFVTELAKENIKEAIKTLAEYLKNLKQNGLDSELVERDKRETLFEMESKVLGPRYDCYDLTSYRDFGRIVTDQNISAMRLQVDKIQLDELIREVFGSTNVVCSVLGDAEKQDMFTLKEIKELFTF